MIPKNSIDDVDIVDKLTDKRYPLGHVDIYLAAQEIKNLREQIINLKQNILDLTEKHNKAVDKIIEI